jgi:uncharacterized protein YggU (UPF0235/DUF167 family)
MGIAIEHSSKHLLELEEVIAQALEKVKGQRETQLSQFIPWKDGHLHHLKFLKLKKSNPNELQKLITKHILEQEQLKPLPAEPRSKSYLRKKRLFEYRLKRSQVDCIVDALEKAGPENAALIKLLRSPLEEEITIEQVRKLMKNMLRDKRVDHKLWATYERLIRNPNS